MKKANELLVSAITLLSKSTAVKTVVKTSGSYTEEELEILLPEIEKDIEFAQSAVLQLLEAKDA